MEHDSVSLQSASVHRALDILEWLAASQRTVGVTDIAERFDVPKATVHRLLATLESRGYVSQDKDDHRYSMGIRCFELGSLWVEQLDLRRVAAPTLKALNDVTGEMVHLAIYDRGEVVYIEKLDSRHSVVCRSYVGRRAPATCVATGRALLAFQPVKEIDRVLAQPVPAHTDHTVTEASALSSLLDDVRRNGYAVNRGSYRDGVGGVATPIRDHTGAVVASVGCCLPEARMSTEERLGFLRDAVVEAGQDISRALGASLSLHKPSVSA